MLWLPAGACIHGWGGVGWGGVITSMAFSFIGHATLLYVLLSFALMGHATVLHVLLNFALMLRYCMFSWTLHSCVMLRYCMFSWTLHSCVMLRYRMFSWPLHSWVMLRTPPWHNMCSCSAGVQAYRVQILKGSWKKWNGCSDQKTAKNMWRWISFRLARNPKNGSFV